MNVADGISRHAGIALWRQIAARLRQDIAAALHAPGEQLPTEAQLSERHVAITLTPAARAWLAAKGYDPAFGARPLARVIQKDVRDPLTDQILFGALEHGGTVTIDAAGDALTFAYATKAVPAEA